MKLILDEVASAMIQQYRINFTRQDVASLWFLCKQYVSFLRDSQAVVYYIKPGNLTVNDCSEDDIGSCVGEVESKDFKCNDLEQEEDIEDGNKKPKMIYLSANANLNDQVSVSDREFKATLPETTEMINLLLTLINDDQSDEIMPLRSNPYALEVLVVEVKVQVLEEDLDPVVVQDNFCGGYDVRMLVPYCSRGVAGGGGGGAVGGGVVSGGGGGEGVSVVVLIRDGCGGGNCSAGYGEDGGSDGGGGVGYDGVGGGISPNELIRGIKVWGGKGNVDEDF
ncbi:keratin, type I cytoskeletal 10-like [Papaver somniferum]|uniref:keratin, type I cytoskeletal 10-like n=1 Tax=Papaver somniferum TaxID=3469 RepID=UPI000E6F758A|nr:keratin, type I cytoskeletal 10-like [Papaver somniferum]